MVVNYRSQRSRGTGRTERMLIDAIAAARDGHAVYIVAANAAQGADLRLRLLNRHAEDLGIKVEAAGTIGNLDWSTLRLQGAHPNTRVFVDHYTVEERIERLVGHEALAMLHRYSPTFSL